MKTSLLKNILASAVLLLTVSSAWALENDQLRGEVLAVDVEERTLTLRVMEVGTNVDEPLYTVKTFKVPESAEVEDDFSSEAFPDTLEDIAEEDIVMIVLDIDDPTIVRGMRNEPA
jgi:hypothetical protein